MQGVTSASAGLLVSCASRCIQPVTRATVVRKRLEGMTPTVGDHPVACGDRRPQSRVRSDGRAARRDQPAAEPAFDPLFEPLRKDARYANLVNR